MNKTRRSMAGGGALVAALLLGLMLAVGPVTGAGLAQTPMGDMAGEMTGVPTASPTALPPPATKQAVGVAPVVVAGPMTPTPSVMLAQPTGDSMTLTPAPGIMAGGMMSGTMGSGMMGSGMMGSGMMGGGTMGGGMTGGGMTGGGMTGGGMMGRGMMGRGMMGGGMMGRSMMSCGMMMGQGAMNSSAGMTGSSR